MAASHTWGNRANVELLDYDGYVDHIVPHATHMIVTESADHLLIVEAKVPPKAGETVQIIYNNPSERRHGEV